MRSTGRYRLFLTTVLLASSAFASEGYFVPFIIPLQCDPNSEIQFSYSPITEQDRLFARENHGESHFYSSKGRVRLWGVNFSFEACFPTYSDAKLIAERLAKAGINAVRLHHMDTVNWPRGIWNSNSNTLSTEALDRLDYFIDQLARHGIYVDLNLHVGKEHSKTIGLPPSPEKNDKMINLFVTPLIEAQKSYARRLLEHQNKYRPWRYCEDPAIAIVEITNENSLFMWSAPKVLPNLPPYYAGILQEQYNRWLKAKYNTTEKLIEAWSVGSTKLENNLLVDSDFSLLSRDKPITGKWRLEQHDNAAAEMIPAVFQDQNVLFVQPTRSDGTAWHLQLNQSNISIRKDRIYTVELRIAAPKERSVVLSVIQANSPWKNLGLYKEISTGPDWKQVRLTFTANENENNARIGITFGSEDTPFYLASITLQPGADFKPAKEESLEKGTVRVFGEIESPTRQLDRLMFLAKTEKKFFDRMRNYLKNDLACKAMITGTIVFGPLGLYAQSDMDFIDAHAYWQHPQWPHKSWDPNDWFIEQKAMSDFPEESTLFKLAAERLHGKPFTITEYNHPAPLDSQAECVPMIASFAAAQDWDGIWLYTYSHSNTNWNRNFMNSYFDIDSNPAKWGFVPAGAAIFRQEGIAYLQNRQVFTCGITLKDIADSHLTYNGNLLRIAEEQWWHGRSFPLNKSIGADFSPTSKFVFHTHSSSPPMPSNIVWSTSEKCYLAKSPKSIVITGASQNISKAAPELCKLSGPAYSSITMTPMDDKYLDQSKAVLITACGRCENKDMQFPTDRQTVGIKWGTGPVQIEAVEGTLDLTELFKDVTGIKVFALDPNGTKKTEIPVTDNTIELSAKYGTMWYLITRSE